MTLNSINTLNYNSYFADFLTTEDDMLMQDVQERVCPSTKTGRFCTGCDISKRF